MTHPFLESTDDESPAIELTWWWVGPTDTTLYHDLVRWIASDRSPRRAKSTWEIIHSEGPIPSLPRSSGKQPGVVIWVIPETGIADLIKRIGEVRSTRPGYHHLTAGLASPNEQRFLTEVGTRGHVQHSKDWPKIANIVTPHPNK
ncbi:hypothetical protein [Rhodopirellula sallentina]|uniref:Uncharacterized protein n=1 Tax=Rhodopirellula sallentina SM41 TaxID=1263870 RepID=M5TUY0_9BACT|nr:hypothetical protein [Rhodopirellula sallentina]EMI52975.1 hypothetical protein RSSM_05603 [Rhodopirellula sallentina SM41]